MVIDEIRSDFTQLQSDIANGPILPMVTAEEIRSYLGSRYDPIGKLAHLAGRQ
jgi:hypothetical protein